MYRVLETTVYNPNVKGIVIDAPHVARRARPGQFVMLRVTENGERIPLTIAASDRERGTVRLIFQEVGKTTRLLGDLEVGESLLDIAGPLGIPSELEGFTRVCVVGGGLGCAIAYPQAAALREAGCAVDIITGFRNKDLIILEPEMRAVSDEYICMTDDGSSGNKGLVTDELKRRLDAGIRYDAVIAIGPLIMMKFVCLATKPYGVKTIVSMNPIMVDGTGMCGCCRVTVNGQVRFACVDGPDFDGHQVDFDEAMRRSATYREQEIIMNENCRLRQRKEAEAHA